MTDPLPAVDLTAAQLQGIPSIADDAVSSEVLLTIIDDILDYSKIEVGKLEIERYPFDLRRSGAREPCP